MSASKVRINNQDLRRKTCSRDKSGLPLELVEAKDLLLLLLLTMLRK